MSVQSSLKQKVKQILTDRCGCRYERTFCRALEYSAYANIVAKAEKKSRKEWGIFKNGKDFPQIDLVTYQWEDEISLAEILKESKKELLVFAAAEGTLSKWALAVITQWAWQHEEQSCFYGDEDVLCGDGRRENPWLKPDWSPELLESMFYIGGVFVLRREAADRAISSLEKKQGQKMRFPEIVMELLHSAGGFEKRREDGKERVGHIPYVLFHHRETASYEKYLRFRCRRENQAEDGKISVIIPSKDHPEVLERNIRSLFRTAKKESFEIIIVDNGSKKENREKVQNLLKEFAPYKLQYIYEPMDFNFSRMCNLGAEKAAGSYLLFLNDDVEAVCDGWMEHMRFCAAKPYAGAVGAKLLYPGTDKIQHAGIVNIPMGPVHKLQFQSDNNIHYFNYNKTRRNVLAVTGACLMVKKERFWEAGGFCEQLPIAFNDVDLCFSLYEKGYYNAVCNDVSFYHHESLSRGDDESAEKAERLGRERMRLYRRHKKLEGKDPYYHRDLNHEGLDTRIVPALQERLETAETVRAKERKNGLKPQDNGRLRYHKGLYFRVESAGGNFCQGYSFMAGDDNSCYVKKMVLEEKESGRSFEVRLRGKLRQELPENMPDQKRVAMCGFAVKITGLPAGNYGMKVLAKNKVTGVTYINECVRRLYICEETDEK